MGITIGVDPGNLSESGGNTQRIVLSCDAERYQERKPCQERLSQAAEVQTLRPAIITSLHAGCPPRGQDLRHSQLLSTRATSEEAWLSPGKGLAEILFRITHPSCFMQMSLTNTEGSPSLSFPSSLLILQCEQPGNYCCLESSAREEREHAGWPHAACRMCLDRYCFDWHLQRPSLLLIAFRALFSQLVSNRTLSWTQWFLMSSGQDSKTCQVY